jgi:hypothetical protein
MRGTSVGPVEVLPQTMDALINHGEFVDAENGKVVFSYAHPTFSAPFTLP